MKCIHHGDLDGRASAAIFYRFYPNADYIESDYREFPVDKINKDEEIIIVDYSCESKELWEKLFEKTNNITWIDHHGTSLDNFRKWFPSKFLKGLQETRRCGAYLSWEWCYGDKKVPGSVAMIDAWDRWVHDDNPTILNFQAGTEAIDINPKVPIWNLILEDNIPTIRQIVNEGAIVRKYKIRHDQEMIEKYSFEMEWEDHKCIVINSDAHGSKTFDCVKGKYDIQISYIFDGRCYEVHLYSEKIHVGELAVKHGGGGHKGAAGFECKELPWREK